MRSIDADVLLDKFLRAYTAQEKKGNFQFVAAEVKQHFVDMICNTPSIDAVPVVRCRECKHGSSGVLDVNCYHPEYDLCEGVTPHEPEFFCAYGERKDGDGNG